MSNWFQSIVPLEDGWYWRKCSETDLAPECIKVHNGIMIDAEPIDSHGNDWHLFENVNFRNWLFNGPIEEPIRIQEHYDCCGF